MRWWFSTLFFHARSFLFPLQHSYTIYRFTFIWFFFENNFPSEDRKASWSRSKSLIKRDEKRNKKNSTFISALKRASLGILHCRLSSRRYSPPSFHSKFLSRRHAKHKHQSMYLKFMSFVMWKSWERGPQKRMRSGCGKVDKLVNMKVQLNLIFNLRSSIPKSSFPTPDRDAAFCQPLRYSTS